MVYKWTGNNNKHYCSVMTYQAGRYFEDRRTHARVAYFSSPNIDHRGQPTGHTLDGDNARTVRKMRQRVANYRPAGVITSADINDNGIVDYQDFAIITSRWQEFGCTDSNNWCGGADLNRDGSLGFQGLVELAEHWLTP